MNLMKALTAMAVALSMSSLGTTGRGTLPKRYSAIQAAPENTMSSTPSPFSVAGKFLNETTNPIGDGRSVEEILSDAYYENEDDLIDDEISTRTLERDTIIIDGKDTIIKNKGNRYHDDKSSSSENPHQIVLKRHLDGVVDYNEHDYKAKKFKALQDVKARRLTDILGVSYRTTHLAPLGAQKDYEKESFEDIFGSSPNITTLTPDGEFYRLKDEFDNHSVAWIYGLCKKIMGWYIGIPTKEEFVNIVQVLHVNGRLREDNEDRFYKNVAKIFIVTGRLGPEVLGYALQQTGGDCSDVWEKFFRGYRDVLSHGKYRMEITRVGPYYVLVVNIDIQTRNLHDLFSVLSLFVRYIKDITGMKIENSRLFQIGDLRKIGEMRLGYLSVHLGNIPTSISSNPLKELLHKTVISTTLKHLDINDCKIDQEILESLSEMGLYTLSLIRCRSIPGSFFDRIPSDSKLANSVRDLKLSYCNIGINDMNAIGNYELDILEIGGGGGLIECIPGNSRLVTSLRNLVLTDYSLSYNDSIRIGGMRLMRFQMDGCTSNGNIKWISGGVLKRSLRKAGFTHQYITKDELKAIFSFRLRSLSLEGSWFEKDYYF
jgi:hypothetical protein